MTVFRVVKNKENPYVIINKEILENPKISLKLKGFLAYCLSKPDNWKFHVRHLATVLKEGKDAIYAIIDEGIQFGYIEREKQTIKGKFESVNYVIHECPIKIISTVSGNPDTDNPDTESPTLINNEIKVCNEENKITSEVQAPAEAPSSPIKKIQEAAKCSALILLSKVKAVHPKCKPPNLDKWAQEFDLINRRDNRSWQEIEEMIAWVFDTSDFWCKQIQSPEALRKHWDKMALQRSSYSNKSILAKKNRAVAQEIKEHLKSMDKEKMLWIGNDHVTNTTKSESVNLDIPAETFELILCKWFGLKKV